MKSNLFMPKKIKVGYNKRSDTYTGQLAYIIYYDDKGKLRKETSWEGWRDKKIPPNDYDNVPTSGFVLNKKVGGYSSGWDHRQTYVRVYDPRGFEFEISVPNLLYILENTNSIKGKGLEGDFVYCYDGKDLVLLPVAAPEYEGIVAYNNKIINNDFVKAKDLLVGATYLDKNGTVYMYLGKHDYYDNDINFYGESPTSSCKLKGKKFYFSILGDRGDYDITHYSTITKKFTEVVDTVVHPDFEKHVEEMESMLCFKEICEPEFCEYSFEDISLKLLANKTATFFAYDERSNGFKKYSLKISNYYNGRRFGEYWTAKKAKKGDLLLYKKVGYYENREIEIIENHKLKEFIEKMKPVYPIVKTIEGKVINNDY